jgi:hypothetical protein
MMATPRRVICYKESPDAWQTKVQRFLRLPFPLAWVLIAATLLAIGYGIVLCYEPDSRALRLLIIEAALIAGIANAVVYSERLLDEVADAFPGLLEEEQDKTREWVRQWYENVFWSKKSMLAGLALGVLVGLISIETVPRFFESPIGKCCGYFFACAVGFLGGSMLWTMLGIARLMASLGGAVRIAPSIFDSSTSALRAASSVLWKVSLTAAALYILGVSIRVLCPAERGVLNIAVTVSFGVFVVLYFIVPQINIHKTLVSLKRNRLRALVKQIDKTFDEVASGPTAENIGQLRDLFDLQRAINGKASWSFGVGELLALIGTILVPLSLFVIDYLTK